MRDFLKAAKLLVVDLASTLLFVTLFLLTHNTILSVSLGMALGLLQIGSQLVRRKPVGTIEWLSLFLIIAAGTGTLLTRDPRFVLFKPSVLYAIAGVVMLKRGWMNRYLPAIARAVGSDVAAVLGFVWAALMFASGGRECAGCPDLQHRDVGFDDECFWNCEQGSGLSCRICRHEGDRRAPRAGHARLET